jgi:hypothetical protein
LCIHLVPSRQMASFKAINTHVRCVTVWDLLKPGKKKKSRRKECDDIIDSLCKKKMFTKIIISFTYICTHKSGKSRYTVNSFCFLCFTANKVCNCMYIREISLILGTDVNNTNEMGKLKIFIVPFWTSSIVENRESPS